jgi:phosphohistidine phosphatase SixA
MRSLYPALSLLLILSTAALISCGGPQDEIQSATSTWILVRHAEKVLDGSADPLLTSAGEERATLLADLLEDSGITHIYTSDFIRTRKTVEPLAHRLGLPLELYDPDSLQIIAGKLLLTPGRVVVCGHSDTTPDLVRLLGGDPVIPKIEDDEYDRLYILNRHADGEVTTLLLRFGERFRE